VELAKRVLHVRKGEFLKLNYAKRRKHHWENKWNVAEKVMRNRKEKTLSCGTSLLGHFLRA